MRRWRQPVWAASAEMQEAITNCVGCRPWPVCDGNITHRIQSLDWRFRFEIELQ